MKISKSEFRKVIEAIRSQYDYDKARSEQLQEIYGSDLMSYDNSRLTNAFFDLLHTVFPPKHGICPIQSFCYDFDFGRSKDIAPTKDPIGDLWGVLILELEVDYTQIEGE